VSEDHNKLREAVAVENGFALYRQYSEKEAARFAHIDSSTLKRWRRKAERDILKKATAFFAKEAT
jgi:hypothetical protein